MMASRMIENPSPQDGNDWPSMPGEDTEWDYEPVFSMWPVHETCWPWQVSDESADTVENVYEEDQEESLSPLSQSLMDDMAALTGPESTRKQTKQKVYTPSQCPICQKWFTRVFNLRCHMRIHTGERPYSCRVCGKAFRLQSDARRHKGLHDGTAKFTCKGIGSQGCGRQFPRADALRRHLRSKAGAACRSATHENESAAHPLQGALDQGTENDAVKRGLESQTSPGTTSTSSMLALSREASLVWETPSADGVYGGPEPNSFERGGVSNTDEELRCGGYTAWWTSFTDAMRARGFDVNATESSCAHSAPDTPEL